MVGRPGPLPPLNPVLPTINGCDVTLLTQTQTSEQECNDLTAMQCQAALNTTYLSNYFKKFGPLLEYRESVDKGY